MHFPNQTAYNDDVEYNIKIFKPGSALNRGFISKQVNLFKEQNNCKEAFYFSTFLDEGYRSEMASLVLSDKKPDAILISAPEDDFAAALDWVKKANDHLQFEDQFKDGLNGDDFVYNRKSAVLKIKPD